ncbi:MAG: SWIM zinc finger family protein, partial [Chloroflexota bacterium]|nr:SWIM zinc finger family protein [Chloroflexota bacterium]
MPAPFIDPAAIRRAARGAGYERGVDCFRRGLVARASWDPATGTLIALVHGNRSHPYRCMIRIDEDHPHGPILSTRCTCPMEADCKHVVAAILASNETAAPSAR